MVSSESNVTRSAAKVLPVGVRQHSDSVTLCRGWSLGVDALMYGLLIACSQGQAVARFLHDGSALGARIHDS